MRAGSSPCSTAHGTNRVSRHRWSIVTCELPPNCGGVGDYTVQVASALAAEGADVTVYTPPRAGSTFEVPHVRLVTLPDQFGRRSRDELDQSLDRASSCVLVQWVPNGFGCRGLNVPWCHWLLHRARRRQTDVRVMFHEPYFYFSWRIERNVLAVGQRLMAGLLARASRQIYVPTDSWHRYLGSLIPPSRPDPITLPIPSTIPRHRPDDRIRSRRAILGLTGCRRIVGHFGTYGTHVAAMLRRRLIALLAAEPAVAAVCIGAGSRSFVRAVLEKNEHLSGRVLAFGRAPGREVAATLAACDLLLQPYPDGVTTRRTSVMAGLFNSCPVLTTSGELTEPIWSSTQAVAMVPAGDPVSFVRAARRLLAERAEQDLLIARGEAAYRTHFDLQHTITQLQRERTGEAA
jgi:glycosyltransferase involved in cell wall biosynthesis